MNIFEKAYGNYYDSVYQAKFKPICCGLIVTKDDNFCKTCGANVRKMFEETEELNENLKIKTIEENNSRREEFKNDLLEFSGFTNHPSAEAIVQYVINKTDSKFNAVIMIEELSTIFNT